jgi:SanA protein
MNQRLVKMILRIACPLLIAGALTLILPRLVTGLYAVSRITSASDAPIKRTAVIFGAGLWSDGSPTPILKDRVRAGAQLYFAGRVEKLLMSGDNRFVNYNEPAAMRDYAVGLGVPAEAIVLDYAGRRTYDTCYRAKAIFGLTDVILVTQKFHLPRALFICNAIGVSAVGVESDLQTYSKSSRLIWNLRELPATLGAFVDLYIRPPFVVLGDPEPIFPDGAQ